MFMQSPHGTNIRYCRGEGGFRRRGRRRAGMSAPRHQPVALGRKPQIFGRPPLATLQVGVIIRRGGGSSAWGIAPQSPWLLFRHNPAAAEFSLVGEGAQ